MKCPKCGAEMHVDEHRRYALNMCYECGYIEGRMNDAVIGETNYQHMKKLSPTETASFLRKTRTGGGFSLLFTSPVPARGRARQRRRPVRSGLRVCPARGCGCPQ